MKKFLTLCVLFSMLLFVAPALIADISEVNLSSNLSFTFEPSSTAVEPLIIIPFADLDVNSIQSNSVIAIEKDVQVLLIVGVSIMLGLFLHSTIVS